MTKVAINKDQSAEKSRKKTAKPRGAAFKPGVSGNPSGRPKGVPNKATADVRAAIALIAERNIEKFEDWLNKTAVDDPGKAASIFLHALEYHIPKLSRSEVTGKDDGPLTNDELRALLKLVTTKPSEVDATPAPEPSPPTTAR